MKFPSPWPSERSVSICSYFLPSVQVVVTEQAYQLAEVQSLVFWENFPRRLREDLTAKLSLKIVDYFAIWRQSCVQKPCSRADCYTKKSGSKEEGDPLVAGDIDTIAEISPARASPELVVVKPHSESMLGYGLSCL